MKNFKRLLPICLLCLVLIAGCGEAEKAAPGGGESGESGQVSTGAVEPAAEGQKSGQPGTPEVEPGPKVKQEKEKQQEKAEYHKISGDEAAAMIGQDAVILDVRTEEEFDGGHIPDAVLLPYDEITAEIAEKILPDKTKKVLIYCRTGRRSAIAATALLDLGYTAVYDFGGITTDWNGEIVK